LPEHPACVALESEENGSMIVVDSRDGESQSGERARHLRADQTAGATHKNCPFSSHQCTLSTFIVLRCTASRHHLSRAASNDISSRRRQVEQINRELKTDLGLGEHQVSKEDGRSRSSLTWRCWRICC